MAELASLRDAVAELVHDGDAVALEGFTHLIPFAAGHELLRQGRRELELVRMTPDLLYDQMIGMCAMFIGDEAAGETLEQQPIARIAGRGISAVDPDDFGIGPVEAANRALRRAGIGWDDVEVVELNEAFAAQSLACLADWDGLDPQRLNPNGGAIAIGHPLGASGVRILGGLAHELRRRGGGYGCAAICSGGGQGDAVILKV